MNWDVLFRLFRLILLESVTMMNPLTLSREESCLPDVLCSFFFLKIKHHFLRMGLRLGVKVWGVLLACGDWVILPPLVWAKIESSEINAPILLFNNECKWECYRIEYSSKHSKWSTKTEFQRYFYSNCVNEPHWVWQSLGMLNRDKRWLSLALCPSNVIKRPEEKMATAHPPQP